MEDIALFVQTHLLVVDFIAFVMLIVVAIVSHYHGLARRALWEDAVFCSQLDDISRDELLKPWLVRLYQRAYLYKQVFRTLLVVALLLFVVIVKQTVPPQSSIQDILIVLRGSLTGVFALLLISNAWMNRISLEIERRELARRFPNLNITFKDLYELHRRDQQFSVDDVTKSIIE